MICQTIDFGDEIDFVDVVDGNLVINVPNSSP